jgi:hypothetical protein
MRNRSVCAAFAQRLRSDWPMFALQLATISQRLPSVCGLRSVCAAFAQRLHSVSATFAQRLRNVCAAIGPCLHYSWTAISQRLPSVCGLRSVCAAFCELIIARRFQANVQRLRTDCTVIALQMHCNFKETMKCLRSVCERLHGDKAISKCLRGECLVFAHHLQCACEAFEMRKRSICAAQ